MFLVEEYLLRTVNNKWDLKKVQLKSKRDNKCPFDRWATQPAWYLVKVRQASGEQVEERAAPVVKMLHQLTRNA